MKNLKTIMTVTAAVGLLWISGTVVRATSTDDRIESSAKSSYVFKTYLNDESISVKSQNGDVILTGSVADASHRSLAENTVLNLPGVKSVDNQLLVRGENGQTNSDAWIATKVRSTLLFHRNVSATNTDVDVQGGVVTLRGMAASQAQKDLTTEYAMGIDGVLDVKNDIAVENNSLAKKSGETASEKIDDASITAQVKMTLLYHRATSALRTNVATKNAIVTLSGKANNPAEKDLATKLASNVKGVRSVRNLMSIDKDAQGV